MDCALTISCDLPTQGTVERLMSHLLEDSSGDPTYVEDFLLTHRIFIDTPLIVCSKLLEWYAPLYTFFFLAVPRTCPAIIVLQGTKRRSNRFSIKEANEVGTDWLNGPKLGSLIHYVGPPNDEILRN